MSTPTILLIDYEPHSIEATLQPLTEVGYRVEVAKDGVAGIEAFRRLHPDLVLLEMILPKKHGLEVCQELRRNDPGGRTPIVMMGRTTTGARYRVQAINSGANDFLQKPIEPERLLEICHSHLTASLGPAAHLALEEVGEGAGMQAAGSPFAASADLADLSEDEIIARLDAMLPSFFPTDADVPPQITKQRPMDAEPFDVGAKLPPGTPEPSAGPEIPHVWAEPPIQLARHAGMPRPVERTPTARASEPRRRPQPVIVDTALPYEVESSRRRGPPWGSLAAAVAAVSAAVLYFTMRNPPSDLGSKTAPGAAPPSAASGTALPRAESSPVSPARTVQDAVAALRDEDVPRERPSSSPATAVEKPAPAPAQVASPPRPLRSEPNPIKAAPAPAKPKRSEEPPRTAVAPASKAPDNPPADPKPEPSRAEVLPSPTPEETIAAPEPPREEPPAPVEAKPVEPEPLPPEVADVVPTAEAEPPRIEAPPRPTVVPGTIVALSDVDSPPAILSRTKPSYPAVALRLRREAVVTLRLLVDETGRVAVVESQSRNASSDFVAEATRAAQTWTYRPATKEGVRVKVWIIEKVVFKL